MGIIPASKANVEEIGLLMAGYSGDEVAAHEK
jgi:hypothetical protein